MYKKIAFSLVFFILLIPLYPSVGLSRYYSHSPRYYGHHHHHRGYHGDAALWWGLGGLLLGTIIVTAAMQPPPQPRVVYSQPQAPVYSYPPAIPPGMCRWERYILDDYGRVVYDQFGQPIKQYTLGSCQYPPN